MNQAKVLFLHAQTALHPGSGSGLGVVDLPIQRERHTEWPMIPGSTLKGVLRDACRRKLSEAQISDSDTDPKLVATFGPPTGEAHLHAGALTLTDARILAFPVRSLCGVFAWITCPAVIERLKRDLALIGETAKPAQPVVVDDGKVLCQTGSSLLAGKDTVVLEEFDFVRTGDPPTPLADLLAQAVHQSAAGTLKTRLAVLSDDEFGYFVRHATEVVARIGLDYEHKTVRRGALFYEEFLPAETVFYALAIASQSRREGDSTDAASILGFLTDCLPQVLQIGGDETIGRGFCFVSLCDSKELFDAAK
jgi:CRISPR-associated protein Cmr4